MNLKELSRLLGLSQTTVSRALNGYPEVSEATRQKVVAAAKKHNYAPSSRARSLATGRSMAIGHVIPISSKHEMVNPIFADFIAGAGETYSRSGYDMLLSVVNDEDEEDAYREMATKGSVDGLIVHGPRENDPRIALLMEIGLPFVVHGRAGNDSRPYSWVDINNGRSFRRATDFLLDLGHQRIALINGIESMDFARRRRLGYEAALQERQVTPRADLMASQEMTEQNAYHTARDMLALPEPPTAFLVSSYISAIGVRRAVALSGLKIGQDVSVITHDDDLSYLRNGDDIPMFTATKSSVRAAGRRCAEIVLDHIANPDLPPVQELWETDLTLGLSTGPAAKELT